jgi:protein-disulfide isomerase
MKKIVTALLLSAHLASPSVATDLDNMSAAERLAFGAEVRAYLLENPEVLMEVIAALEQRQAQSAVTDDATLVQVNADELFNDGYSFIGGNPDGDITMVEFLDYKCGYCKKAHPEVSQLLKSDGNIRYIVKEFPILGDESTLASRFAISVLHIAGPQAYARAHDELMTLRGTINDATLERLANTIGLDYGALRVGMDMPAVDAVLANNHALAQRMKISGTPSFILGPQMMRGYVPLENMQQIVAEVRGN